MVLSVCHVAINRTDLGDGKLLLQPPEYPLPLCVRAYSLPLVLLDAVLRLRGH